MALWYLNKFYTHVSQWQLSNYSFECVGIRYGLPLLFALFLCVMPMSSSLWIWFIPYTIHINENKHKPPFSIPLNVYAVVLAMPTTKLIHQNKIWVDLDFRLNTHIGQLFVTRFSLFVCFDFSIIVCLFMCACSCISVHILLCLAAKQSKWKFLYWTNWPFLFRVYEKLSFYCLVWYEERISIDHFKIAILLKTQIITNLKTKRVKKIRRGKVLK